MRSSGAILQEMGLGRLFQNIAYRRLPARQWRLRRWLVHLTQILANIAADFCRSSLKSLCVVRDWATHISETIDHYSPPHPSRHAIALQCCLGQEKDRACLWYVPILPQASKICMFSDFLTFFLKQHRLDASMLCKNWYDTLVGPLKVLISAYY